MTRTSSRVRTVLVALATALTVPATAASPIIIRHDRMDAEYLELGQRVSRGLVHMNLETPGSPPDGEGTLIAPQWVLTAAHVAVEVEPGHTLTIGGHDYEAAATFVHPEWDDGASDDIGLVRLTSPVTGIEPLELYPHVDEVGRVVTVVGRGDFGTGETGPEGNDGRVRGATNTVDGANAKLLWWRFDAPGDSDATRLEGISGPGDSGGPALMEVNDTRYVVGVSSAQSTQATGGQEGVYGVTEYYVRLSSYVDWIVRIIDANPANTQDARTFEIAVTVDDLPWSGPAPRGDVPLTANHRILETLAERDVPAVGFVVCDAVRDGRILRAWLDGGHGLGNHTAAHHGLDNTDPRVWLRGVERCDQFLRDLTDPVYFRYPMLHRGSAAELRDSMAEAVRHLGYRLAPVTVDNSEWVIAAQYRAAAARGDSATLRALGIAYVAHVRRATRHARTIAEARFGRDVRHVLLLHANLLNADWMGALLDSLAADGARFVSLDHALADSVYALPDDYAGEKGLSWLYRVSPAQPALALWDEEEEHALRTTVHHDGMAPALVREIADRGQAFSATYLRRDPAGLGQFYTEDAVLVLPGGRVIAGGEAIERYWTLGPSVRALEHHLRPERLYGDATRVVEIGRWFSTSQRDGAEPTSAAGRYVVEWVRGSEAPWRMRVDTWHRDDGEAR